VALTADCKCHMVDVHLCGADTQSYVALTADCKCHMVDVHLCGADTQSYVLNFHGRVTQASVKNFQIVHDNDGERRLRVTVDD